MTSRYKFKPTWRPACLVSSLNWHGSLITCNTRTATNGEPLLQVCPRTEVVKRVEILESHAQKDHTTYPTSRHSPNRSENHHTRPAVIGHQQRNGL